MQQNTPWATPGFSLAPFPHRFQIYTGWSGQRIYDDWYQTLFNIVFTSMPVFIFCIFDKDINSATIRSHPQVHTAADTSRLTQPLHAFACVDPLLSQPNLCAHMHGCAWRSAAHIIAQMRTRRRLRRGSAFMQLLAGLPAGAEACPLHASVICRMGGLWNPALSRAVPLPPQVCERRGGTKLICSVPPPSSRIVVVLY